MSPMDSKAEIEAIRQRLVEIDRERANLSERLAELTASRTPAPVEVSPLAAEVSKGPAPVTSNSTPAEKIALFRRLFGGRTDVFPARWENPKSGKSGYAPACANEWVRGVCGKPQVKCGECPNQKFIPVTPDVIECHLRGEDRVRPNGRGGPFVVGAYPLLFDDTCGFLAVDFDGDAWTEDARAFIATCHEAGVVAALERSRSGNGGHIWIFFSEPVPASEARRLGSFF
jgi:hypothetical protein